MIEKENKEIKQRLEKNIYNKPVKIKNLTPRRSTDVKSFW